MFEELDEAIGFVSMRCMFVGLLVDKTGPLSVTTSSSGSDMVSKFVSTMSFLLVVLPYDSITGLAIPIRLLAKVSLATAMT